MNTVWKLLGDAELLRHLTPPLRRQRRRNDDENVAGSIVKEVLPNQQSGFDRLPKANFVREKVALRCILKHSSGGFDLMRMKFDRRRRQSRDPLIRGRPGKVRMYELTSSVIEPPRFGC